MEDDPEIARLQAWGRELAGAEQSPWQPRCVAMAFVRRDPHELVLTMQRWIELDAVRSPFLEFRTPSGDWEEVAEAIVDAARIFDLPRQEVTAEEAAELAEVILQAVCAAFAMGLKMRPSGESETVPDDGFGSWLPILTRLLTDLQMSRQEALETPVGQAFALIAAWRHNQGWHTTETGNYVTRELAEEEVADA